MTLPYFSLLLTQRYLFSYEGLFGVMYDIDSLESPLLWIRGDPELEYLAELNLLQPEHMWVCLNNFFRCS